MQKKAKENMCLYVVCRKGVKRASSTNCVVVLFLWFCFERMVVYSFHQLASKRLIPLLPPSVLSRKMRNVASGMFVKKYFNICI